MQTKVRGIVLNHIKFRESSIIVRVYTLEYGLVSFIVNGVRSKSQKKGSKIALYQPLTILDVVAYIRNDKDLHRISEAKGVATYNSIPYEFKKTSIAIFIAELLSKTLRDEDENEGLYRFLESSLLTLDALEEDYENFHLQFFLKLTRFLGFLPSSVQEVRSQLTQASTNHRINTSGLQLQQEITALMDQDYLSVTPLNRQKRQALLDIIIHYYDLHLDGLGEIKSLKVLKEIMS